MRVIIIGNGLAGTIAAKTLREQDKTVEIEVFADLEAIDHMPHVLADFCAAPAHLVHTTTTAGD